jgi:WD40 repeat protein
MNCLTTAVVLATFALNQFTPKDGAKQESDVAAGKYHGLPQLLTKPIAVFTGDNRHDISSLSFSPDSKFLAAAEGMNGSVVRVWDLGEKKEKLVWKDNDRMGAWSVRFAGNGKLLMAASMGKNFQESRFLTIWDVSSWKRLKDLPFWGSPVGVVLTPDSKFAVVGVEGPADRAMPFGAGFFNLENGKAEFDLLGHWQGIECFTLSSDGALLATGGTDKLLKVWDVKTKTMQFSLEPEMDRIRALAFSPDHSMLAVGGDWNKELLLKGKVPPDLKLYDIKKREELNYIPPFNHVRAVGFCPGTPCLGVLTRAVSLLNFKNGSVLVVPPGGHATFTSFSFSPDGKLLAIGDDLGNVRLWKTPEPGFK